MKKRLTTEEFVERSKRKYGDKYLYEKVEYVRYNDKVIITCPKHGDFTQTPNRHLRGYVGCRDCYKEVYGVNKHNFWTYEKCYEIAKQFKTMSEFRNVERVGYLACKKNKWLKKFTWLKRHYEQDEDVLTARKHCIYKYEFEEHNSVYIGLTIDLNRRHRRGHSEEGSVYNFCKANNLDISKPEIVEDNLTLDEAKIRENYWIDYYREQGYNLLNKVKAGSVGTLHKIKSGKETDEFIFKAKAIHGDRYSYTKAVYVNSKTKVIITCPIHGDYYQKPYSHLSGSGCPICGNGKISVKRTKWTYETCKIESEKYRSRNGFQKGSSGAYEISRKSGWLDEFYPKK